eukprot:XP_003728394.1 PREDICTED: proline-rich receptor-like protein kinase PERK8 isoform X1 [Strongylocentrotus purpuratus]
MGTLHCLCRLVVLLSLSVIRETVTSPNDQCQFIFKEDSVLQVALSQDAGAKVTMDLHAENKFKCAEACCESEGEWCTLAVFHTKTYPEAMNCFLVQCVPDGSENNVCITKHVRRSGFISATVKHPPPPTSPAPSTTPSIPPPPPSSPDTPSISVNTSAPPLAPISPPTSPPTSPPHSSSDASSNAATSSSDVISANNSVEALNNLNAVINSSLTSPSSNPATTNVKPSPTTVAATDIPTPKPPTVQTTAKSSTKATTKPTAKAEIADTTPAPKWTSPVSLTASQMLDSNATQPINVTQSGQDGTESPGEIKHDNINRTTVTQTGILIVTLCFGIIFLLAMMVVVGKRWCEGYQRRKYSKVDYLINGYYS